MKTETLKPARKPQTKSSYVKWFREIGIKDVPSVGGKTASLGEMFRELTPKGVKVPDGFAITTQAYRIEQKIDSISSNPDTVMKTTVAILEKENSRNQTTKERTK